MSTKSRLTLEEYDRMIERGVFDPPYDRRIELIHGELREMPPAGPTHNEAIRQLNEWSFENIEKEQARISIQCAIGLAELESAPEPDVAWLKPKRFRDAHPTADDVLLVIEVADASLAFDRGEKASLYAEAGIADYWIINIRDWCVEVHRDPARDTYGSVTNHNVHDTISPLAFPEISLDVGTLFET